MRRLDYSVCTQRGSDLNFQVGELYYRCFISEEAGKVFPVVETWVYQGYFEKSFSSTSCDRPNWFYQFIQYGTDGSSPIYIPTAVQLEGSMLSLDEFLGEFELIREELAK